jgi:hypothetical protein
VPSITSARLAGRQIHDECQPGTWDDRDVEQVRRAFARYARPASEQDRLDETFADGTGCVPQVLHRSGSDRPGAQAARRRTLVVGALASAGATMPR